MKRMLAFYLVCFSFLLKAQYVEHMYHFNVDNLPDIYGGKTEMKRFLHDHLVYPPEELKSNKEGIVTINFIVTAEGKTFQPVVAKSASPAMDKEALRLLKLIEWIPSRQNGTAVNVKHSIDITFSVSKYKKMVKERGFDQPPFKEYAADTSLVVYESAESPPSFDIPDKTFTEFISSNLEYPEIAARQNIQGDVRLSFVVEPDGRISDIKILNEGLAAGCNDEAIRVTGLTKWTPAVSNRRYVRFRMINTVRFSLTNNFKDNSNGTQRSWGQ